MQVFSLLIVLSLVPARAIHEGFHVLGGAIWLTDWEITLCADSGTVSLKWQPDAPWYAPAVAYIAPLVGAVSVLAVIAGLMLVDGRPATAVGRASTVVACLWLFRAGVLSLGDWRSAVVLAREREWTPAGGVQ